MATLMENAQAIANGYNEYRAVINGTATEVNIPKGVTEIKNYAFYNSTNLHTITLPNGLITIGNDSFAYCNLQSLTIPNTVESIGDGAFAYGGDTSTSNVQLIIPASVKLIENQAFYRWKNLIKIVLEHGVEQLRNDVFTLCNNVTDLTIPNTLTNIGNRCFESCTSLVNVTIENGFNCDNLNLSASIEYTVATIVSWLNALANLTGETAKTLIIGSPNIAKLSAEQIAIATNKNWNLA